ncbi:MAG TPA: polysaccharide deacetylase family protein [Alphaproteobacteria bacterium]|nr:polysaccharide deacetylase family protein [Alphaproteobacteria bacterium]
MTWGALRSWLIAKAVQFCMRLHLWRRVNAVCAHWQLVRNSDAHIAFPFIQRQRSRSIIILAYHRVNDGRDPFWPALPTAVFARQMEYLATFCHCYGLEEAVARLTDNDVQDNAVAVTFDDGYRDNYLKAFPILQRFSIPATIFVATDAIGSGRILWHDQVSAAVWTTQASVLKGCRPIGRSYELQTPQSRREAQTAILHALRALDEEERAQWVAWLQRELAVEPWLQASELMLTWDDIKVMHQHGIEFGAHTATHPVLSRVTSARAWAEIAESKATLEQHLGGPVRGFAYPSGRRQDFTATTKRLVQDAGYGYAVTMVLGVNHGASDPFELQRIPAWDTDMSTFGARLSYYRVCL